MPTPEEIAAAAETKRLADEATAKKKVDDAAIAAAEDAKKKGDPLAVFNEYLETLDEDTRTTIEGHVKGLKTALVAEREISKTNKGNATRLKELEDAEIKRKQDAMSDAEKVALAKTQAEARAVKAEADLRTERIKNAVLAEATKLNFKDPQDAYTLIDLAALKTDEAGKISGVEEALSTLVKAKPYLIETGERQVFDINGRNRGPVKKTKKSEPTGAIKF